MPILPFTETKATAGILYSTIIKKPIGAKIIIRHITVTTKDTTGTFFPECRGHLRVVGKGTGPTIGLYDKRPARTHQSNGGAVVFEGASEWPDGWEFKGQFRIQNTPDTIYYVIEYDIVEIEKKRGWGQ